MATTSGEAPFDGPTGLRQMEEANERYLVAAARLREILEGWGPAEEGALPHLHVAAPLPPVERAVPGPGDLLVGTGSADDPRIDAWLDQHPLDGSTIVGKAPLHDRNVAGVPAHRRRMSGNRPSASRGVGWLVDLAAVTVLVVGVIVLVALLG